jgi:nanoRNase/pAp phosphatase (c-di-AMP/oligoRNAs hydrolase)
MGKLSRGCPGTKARNSFHGNQFRGVGCQEKNDTMSRQSADPGVNGRSSTLSRRSDRFLAGLTDFKGVTFVSHVHPDPDSLGSMAGLAYLVETCLGKPTRMTRDGLISRAENRVMVDTLHLDLVPIEEARWDAGEAVVMVDSQPCTGRHNIPADVPIYAVIDHHQTPGDVANIPFLDIRRSVGATCSVVTRYLMEQEIALSERVATCLYYGIETELVGYPREASSLDDSALHFLYPLANKDALAKIRNAPLPEAFYETLLQGLQSSFIYDRLLISWINDLPMPELCSQTVDFLIRHEGINWALCAGVYADQMILSLRTNVSRAQAGEILRQVACKMGGRAGGHDRRAGGCIPLTSTSASAIDQVQSEFRRRLLKALQIEEQRGRRLVPVRAMLQNMQ